MDKREQWDALAAGFGALGRLHREAPDPEILANIRGLMGEWPLPATEAAQRGLALLEASAAANEDAETIRLDHARLYGVMATAVVPPYESVHRGEDGLVFDSDTLHVRAAYRALSLQAPRLNREPDDHIGLEFDFVSQALDRAVVASEPTPLVAAARAMLDDHLDQWAPNMLTNMAAAAATAFMAGVAWLSVGALDSARQSLG